MHLLSVVVFLFTYAGIAFGGYPRLVIDRTGVALLGAMCMVVCGVLLPEEAADSVHFPTLLLLYGLMIVSAQLRLGGFYTWLAQKVVGWSDHGARFLLALMVVSGFLSSVLANDIICLAFTPVLAVALRRRGLNPVPFLLGLAMATNLGSASTLIGNPQSMLIGQVAGLSFRDFLLWCAPPSILGLFATYGVLLAVYRGRLEAKDGGGETEWHGQSWPDFNLWQSAKGLIAALAVVVLMFTEFPREWSVLAVSGMLLLSRKMHTRAVLGIVDWHLITLFCGLFIVVRGLNESAVPERIVCFLAERGLEFGNPYVIAGLAGGISNMVSNVPAAVLLIPHIPPGNPNLWYVLSLASTYAGNLLTIGSMANLIVIEQAKVCGIKIGFMEYARTGIVVTATNFLILYGWIWLKS